MKTIKNILLIMGLVVIGGTGFDNVGAALANPGELVIKNVLGLEKLTNLTSLQLLGNNSFTKTIEVIKGEIIILIV